MSTALPYTSFPFRPDLADVLRQLQAGMKVKIIQTVRIGSTKTWQAVVTGTFRHLDALATGLATDRVAQDDIIIPMLHFTKDSGELSSVALDEFSKVEIGG